MVTRLGMDPPREHWDQPRDATPWLPEDRDHSLLHHAVEMIHASARLEGLVPGPVRAAVADLLRYVNSYYSNLIEGHSTYPKDIERAMHGAYADSEERRDLQIEARLHVEAERRLRARLASPAAPAATSPDFILWLHRALCRGLPQRLLTSTAGTRAVDVVPGALREDLVEIGSHEPPVPASVPAFLDAFHAAYNPTNMPRAQAVIAAAASHHRLLWIHPFLDGNGRVTRLFTHGYLMQAGVGAQGLWSMSRGFARHNREYRRALAAADATRAHDTDGRGNLSDTGLHGFCIHFMKVALDQIEFVERMLGPEGFMPRLMAMAKRREEAGTLPPRSAHVLREAIYREALPRGEALAAFDQAERTARKHLAALVDSGLLIADGDTHRSALRFAIPTAFGEELFPGLYPADNTAPAVAAIVPVPPSIVFRLRNMSPKGLHVTMERYIADNRSVLFTNMRVDEVLSTSVAECFMLHEVDQDPADIDMSSDTEVSVPFTFTVTGSVFDNEDEDRLLAIHHFRGSAVATISASGDYAVTVSSFALDRVSEQDEREEDAESASPTVDHPPR
jgi:Fic family protein